MKHNNNDILYGLFGIFIVNLLFFIASYTLLWLDNMNNACCYKLSFDDNDTCQICDFVIDKNICNYTENIWQLSSALYFS